MDYLIDEGTSKKNDKSNFRPVSILITFSKIHEKVTINVIETTMNKYLSPSISAYQQNHSTQHVLICLLEECKEGLDIYFFRGKCFPGFM